MAEEALRERLQQLCRGVRGAAAALPPAHAGTGDRAIGAAERLSAAARELSPTSPDGAEEEIRAALERVESAHYALLRVAVLEQSPEEAQLERELSGLEEVAERLQWLLGGERAGADSTGGS